MTSPLNLKRQKLVKKIEKGVFLSFSDFIYLFKLEKPKKEQGNLEIREAVLSYYQGQYFPREFDSIDLLCRSVNVSRKVPISKIMNISANVLAWVEFSLAELLESIDSPTKKKLFFSLFKNFLQALEKERHSFVKLADGASLLDSPILFKMLTKRILELSDDDAEIATQKFSFELNQLDDLYDGSIHPVFLDLLEILYPEIDFSDYETAELDWHIGNILYVIVILKSAEFKLEEIGFSLAREICYPSKIRESDE